MDLKNVFIKIRCPNRPYDDSDERSHYFCGSLIGGINAEELASRDWSTPFFDIRRCGSCGTIWKITIKDMFDIPLFDRINGHTIDFIDFDSLFNLKKIKGRKVKVA